MSAQKEKKPTKHQVDMQEIDHLSTKNNTKATLNPGLALGSAVLVAALPCFVYSQIYDVSLTTYAIMFLLLTAGAAFALNQSYVAAFEAEHTRLSIQAQKAHKGGDFKKHGFESQASMDASRGQTLIDQATAWTFLYGNGTFLFAFYFVAFYMFANADIVIGYCMATFAAAVVTFAITGAKLK